MTTTFISPVALSYICHVWTNAGVFKKTIKCLNTPTLSYVVNSTGLNITLEMAASNTGTPTITQGDIIKITEQEGDGSVLYTGVVEDIPDDIDQTVNHQLVLAPIGVEAADVDFTHNYSALTDVSVMIRDAVAGCLHLTATTLTVPDTGLTRIFNFNEKSVLDVLQTCAKMAGANYVWFIDELGQVFFGPSSSGILYSTRTRVDAPVRKYTAPITNQRNYVKAFGSIPPGGTTKIVAFYDQSGSSTIGKRALLPPLQFPGLTDQSTLQSIVNTIGAALNQPQVTVILEMPNSGTRINLARVGGANIRYWEPNQDDLAETDPGSGTFSPNYVIVQVDITGPVQRVTARGIALNVDDFVNEINNNLDRVATDGTAPTIVGTLPIYPGQVVGATTGGPSTPSTTAWVFAQWSTGIENVAQVNNAFAIVKWTPNAANENIQRYEVRYSKNADGNYFSQSALAGVVDGGGRGFLKIAGLLQGTSYTYEIRAINNLGIASAWSSTQAQTTALDASGPAVPTGLAAIKTPRGALVSWNANSEADLKGYHLQVSVGGGGYTDVTVDSLLTSFYYVAPSGTATGTSLTFKILAADWSGNFSAYSSASSAVATDGIVMDELLVGNLQVFGTMTTGGFQTATSGKRLVIDGTSLRLYDGSTTPYGAPSGPGITVELLASGVGFFQGTVSASKVYGGTLATSAAHDSPNPPSSAGSGFKLKDQFLDLYTVSSISEGTRYWYSPDSVTPFTLAGLLAAGSMTFAKGAADSDTETMTSTGGPIKNSALAIASFKPSTASTAIAKRGSFGAFTISSGSPVTPPFGQATASGNLLTALVACNPATPGAGTGITTASSGWTRATTAISGNVQTDIWFKLNCGAIETAPTFSSVLQAPSAADQVVETITDAGGGAQTANIANIVLASFSPASSSVPITLVSLGSFTTGTVSQASPAFGAPTTGGNLLLAWVSGDTGIASGGTTTGGWGTATTTFNFSGVNSDNLVFMGPYTMPQLGRITSISVNMGGYDGSQGIFAGSNADTTLVIWDGAGNVLAYGSMVTYGQGRTLRTQAIAFNASSGSITFIDVAAGQQVYVGFFRARGQTCMWGVRTVGTFKYKTNQTGFGSVGGYTNAAPSYIVGDMQSYFTYTILTAGTDITTSASGWSKATQSTNSLAQTQLWYKQNCGSSEAAPVFTSASGAKTMYAQLGEFAGVATGSPQDKVGNTNQGAASTSITVTGSAIDTQSGNLVVTASRFEFASAATASFSDTLNNGSPISAGNSGGSANIDHANFVYGIVPVPTMHAQVQEWTGALTAGALDQIGNTGQASAATSISVLAGGLDGANGDLVLTTGRWFQTGNSTASWTDAYNNASPLSVGNSGGSSLSQHSNFTYGIIAGSTTGAVLQLTNFVGLEAITLDKSLGRGFVTTQYSDDTFGSSFIGRKSRGTGPLSPGPVVTGDSIFSHYASAFNGTNWYNVGRTSWDINQATLVADSATETAVAATTPLSNTVMAIASFKVVSPIAIVGSAGTLAIGTNTSVSPTFGQATTAGHLLVAFVSGETSGVTLTTAASGWVQAVANLTLGRNATIWYKPNCGAGETAPTFTLASGASPMHAQLVEFSGVATSTPVDQTGTATQTLMTLTGTTGGVDTARGNLIVQATRWSLNASVTATFVEAYNNGVVPVTVGNTGGSAAFNHSLFSYGIVGTIAGGQIPTDFNIRLNPGTGEFTAMSFKADGSGMVGVWTKFRARATMSANQSATFDTSVKVLFDTIDYDPNNNYDTVNKRYTAPITGYYLIAFTVNNSPGAQTGYLEAWLRKNGSDIPAVGAYATVAANNWNAGSSGTHVIKLTAGDYLEVWFNMQSTVAASTIIGGLGNTSSAWSVMFMGT